MQAPCLPRSHFLYIFGSFYVLNRKQNGFSSLRPQSLLARYTGLTFPRKSVFIELRCKKPLKFLPYMTQNILKCAEAVQILYILELRINSTLQYRNSFKMLCWVLKSCNSQNLSISHSSLPNLLRSV